MHKTTENKTIEYEATNNKKTDNYDFCTDLNPQQLQAVNHINEPLLILAGAGTGKTKTLAVRVACILRRGLAYRNQLLTVTFTNKAAEEMKNRINLYTNDYSHLPWNGTFHSICAKILRINANLIGLDNKFTIIDMADQLSIIKKLMPADIEANHKFSPNMILEKIEGWKNANLSVEDVLKGQRLSDENIDIINLYGDYQEKLQELTCVDFGDLIMRCNSLFQTNPNVLEYYQQKFKYIHVDEYQDTNEAQYVWLKLLSGQLNYQDKSKACNICCVGDDDQSIYGWRGAQIKNILNFQKDFKDTKIIKLEQNYRSTKHILNFANHLIKENTKRLDKKLWSTKTSHKKVKINKHWDHKNEAEFISQKIIKLNDATVNLKQIAILVRSSYQFRVFEESFNQHTIPYQVIGGPRFYEREETKDAISYLRLIHSSRDILAGLRIINKPRRGVGNKTIDLIQTLSEQRQIDFISAIKVGLDERHIKGKAYKSLQELFYLINKWRQKVDKIKPGELMRLILDDINYFSFLQKSSPIKASTKIENLKELVTAANQYEDLNSYIEQVSLISEASKNHDNCVMLMTLHAAKGLEFENVFLPGWEYNIIPSQRTIEQSGIDGLEEERRLAYVGVTRAKEQLTISYCLNREIFGRWQSQIPTPLLETIPEDAFEFKDHTNFKQNHLQYSTPQHRNDFYSSNEDFDGHSSKDFKQDFDEDLTFKNTDHNINSHDNNSLKKVSQNFAALHKNNYSQQSNKILDQDLGSHISDFPIDNYITSDNLSLKQRYKQQKSLKQTTQNCPQTLENQTSKNPNFSVGDRISHQRFGLGYIVNINGSKLSINFSGIEKTIIDSFVHLA